MILKLAVLAIGVLFLYSFLIEPNRIKIKRYKVGSKGIKVALLSDYHCNWTPGRIESWFVSRMYRALSREKPDLIFLLGDFVTSFPRRPFSVACLRWVRSLERLGIPIIAVWGNHDLSHPSFNSLKEALSQGKVILLEGEKKEIEVKGKKILVVGIPDFLPQQEKLEKSLSSLASESTAEFYSYKIIASHSPDLLSFWPQKKGYIFFFGHTHGGQIRLPLVGPLILPLRFAKKYDRGRFSEKGYEVIVTPGLGTSGPPLRFLSPPEITIVEL